MNRLLPAESITVHLITQADLDLPKVSIPLYASRAAEVDARHLVEKSLSGAFLGKSPAISHPEPIMQALRAAFFSKCSIRAPIHPSKEPRTNCCRISNQK